MLRFSGFFQTRVTKGTGYESHCSGRNLKLEEFSQRWSKLQQMCKLKEHGIVLFIYLLPYNYFEQTKRGNPIRICYLRASFSLGVSPLPCSLGVSSSCLLPSSDPMGHLGENCPFWKLEGFLLPRFLLSFLFPLGSFTGDGK